MNINLLFETILILFAILASNGIIYSLTLFNSNNSNSSKNMSFITNSSKKDRLALTWLIASNPLSITSSESSASQTLSVTSSDSDVSESIFESDYVSVNYVDSQINDTTQTANSYLSSTNNEIIPSNVSNYYTSLDSWTILDSQSYEQWRELALGIHQFPIETPINILQLWKHEELSILFSQDMIRFAITHSELRIIIDHFSAMSLYYHDFNHVILTVMAHYHS